ncbi:transcriptional repressor [Paraburkholderia sp. EG287A]|uniref:transcriptional repressor n=1 Tax=Paraburkholderia sp. EG287A TaxID=3237012 RepID=UPI0034D26EC7
MAVLKVFHEAPREHLSADQVFRRIAKDVEQCSLARVYRALAQLMETQALTSTWIGGTRMVYELGRRVPHAHTRLAGTARRQCVGKTLPLHASSVAVRLRKRPIPI